MDAPATCPLHGLPLERRKTSVLYGLPYFPPGYDDALATQFPHGGDPPLGGCCLPPVPETVELAVCPRCADARRAWWRARKRS